MPWWKAQQTDEAREKCRAWFRASMHRLLAYTRLQVDEETDVEMLLSGVIERVTQACVQGRVPAEEEDLLRYSMRSIWHDALRMRERNKNRREAEIHYTAGHGATPTEQHPHAAGADAATQASLLRRALRELPEEQAELITLHIWQELSIAEIARRCNTAESTIRSRYTVALRAVKAKLKQFDIR